MSRIHLEEESTDTKSQLEEAKSLAESQGWKSIVIVSNEYHLPRVRALWETVKSELTPVCIAAEDILGEADPTFLQAFRALKETPAYKERVRAEQAGVEALGRGVYESKEEKDKGERAV